MFGSTATEHICHDSDIDIAFLSDERSLEHYERFMLAQQLTNRRCEHAPPKLFLELFHLSQSSFHSSNKTEMRGGWETVKI
ncbi:nucleotidyltransferase domain-containing protein [Anoxybacillus sp. TBDG-1]